jgi:S1/P1 Nuclease
MISHTGQSPEPSAKVTADKLNLIWHYVEFPLRPGGEPATIQTVPPARENILTAIPVNERIVRHGTDPVRRGIALGWLCHLIGDVHQPLHAAQLFSGEYPNSDPGGLEMCVRVA